MSDDVLLAQLIHKMLPFLLVKNQKISNFPLILQKFPEIVADSSAVFATKKMSIKKSVNIIPQ